MKRSNPTSNRGGGIESEAEHIVSCRKFKVEEENTINIGHLNMAQNFEERICELVRGYKHLYDATVPGHRDKQRCKNSWEEIASAVGLPVKQVRNKWNMTRDRFVRAHNKARASKSGDAAGGPEHPVLQRLAWLRVHVRHRSTSSNFDTQDQAEEEIMEEEEKEEEEGGEDEEGVSPPAGHGVSSPPPPTEVGSTPRSQSPQPGASKRRRKNPQVDQVDEALLGRLDELRREAQQSRNVFSTFTTYLNSFLQELPAADGKRLVKEIQQLMLTYQ